MHIHYWVCNVSFRENIYLLSSLYPAVEILKILHTVLGKPVSLLSIATPRHSAAQCSPGLCPASDYLVSIKAYSQLSQVLVIIILSAPVRVAY